MDFILMGVGVFVFMGTVLRWPFFLGHWKAKALSRLLGEQGMRIFYALIGVLLFGMGLFGLMKKP